MPSAGGLIALSYDRAAGSQCPRVQPLFGESSESQPLRKIEPDALRHKGYPQAELGCCQLRLDLQYFLHRLSGLVHLSRFRETCRKEAQRDCKARVLSERFLRACSSLFVSPTDKM